MLRVDPDVVPTMFKTPTLGTWELELLQSIERVVRKGHVRHAAPGELVFDDGAVAGVGPHAGQSLDALCADAEIATGAD